MDARVLNKRHNEAARPKGQRELFTIWLALMFLSVISAHFILNMAGTSPTGYAFATEESALGGITSLLGSIAIFVFAALVGALAYFGITRNVG